MLNTSFERPSPQNTAAIKLLAMAANGPKCSGNGGGAPALTERRVARRDARPVVDGIARELPTAARAAKRRPNGRRKKGSPRDKR